MNLFEYLNIFHPLPVFDFEILKKLLKPQRFAKGEFIIQPGQTQNRLYFVNNGVQMSYYESEQKTHVIAFTYPPNLCAIPESFSFQKPSNYFLTCLSNSEMEYITYDDLQDLFKQSLQIERLFRKMNEAMLAGMINRHIELQSATIEERYLSFCRRSPHLLQLVPHKYIASYLCIDPTNFSKLYNRIKF